MAHVQDRWHTLTADPDNPAAAPKRVRSARYGKGLRWMAEYRSPLGRKMRKAFATKDAATAFVQDVESDKRRGLYVVPNKVTMTELWPGWIGARERLAKPTKVGYEAAWSRYIEPKWGDVPLASIDKVDVLEWLPTLRLKTGQPLSASWARKVVIVMRGLLDWAVDGKLVPSNPLLKMGKALPQQKPSDRRALSVAEADRLLEAMGDQALPVLVMLRTGIRRGEMAGLQVRDLDVSRRRLRIERDIDEDGEIDQTKSRLHRDVPVPAELLDQLRAATKGRARTAWLLPAPTGRPWVRDSWRTVWEKARAAADLDGLDTHELRHTAITWAIRSGATVKTVQRMAGHAKASITLDVYGHLWEDDLDTLPGRVDAFLKLERQRVVGEDLGEAAHQSPTENAGRSA